MAVVHDWFTEYYGSERVVEEMLRCFPEADLFALVDFLPAERRSFLMDKPVHTSLIQKLPWSRRNLRLYLPFMPLTVEQFDLSGYDIVLSSSMAFAKGVLTGTNQLHIAYVHSPIRQGWEYQHVYLREIGLSWGLRSLVVRQLLHRLRLWDVRTANGVDHFVANSHFIRRRIDKVYRRNAAVIHPPVDVASFTVRREKDDFYLAVTRFDPDKRPDILLDAFATLTDRRLIVVGGDTGGKAIRRRAPANVTILPWQSAAALRDLLGRARAVLVAAEDDFGLAQVEAQASGTPVIAFAGGGSLETVSGLGAAEPTGVFFDDQTADSLIEAIHRFEQHGGAITPDNCRRNAERFDRQVFRRAFFELVSDAWTAHVDRLAEGLGPVDATLSNMTKVSP
ncbi:glycosyltransferase [Marinivivus vitaminiproducens]|uniref:glycosyltransferase n=1 Tax=Marinivivus vitaminiproducens TaxID=3035935 RepID=UPI0027AA6ECD|nr:glycosyltransferase [Geminicoccaceae bacterium SCSIO 64248]